MKTSLASLVVAIAVAFASNAFAAAPAKSIELAAKPGTVTFKHSTHTAQKCTACHADEKGGDIAGVGADMDKEKAHALCQGCHKKEAKGPQKCADCHKKA